MKVRTIRLPLTHRINVGEFESVEVTVDLTAELDPGEEADQAYAALRGEALRLWKQEAILTLKGVLLRRRDTGKPTEVPESLLRHMASLK